MRYTTASSVSFDVGHASPHPAACARLHGHTAAIRIGCSGAPLPEQSSFTIDPDTLLGALGAIQAELANRDLGEMIAPAKPTAAGLAGWVWERLALGWGEGLAFVEVEFGGLSARIEP